MPLPTAAAVMSPWTDLSASGASFETRAASDPIHQRPMMLAMARNYLGTDAPGLAKNDRGLANDPRDPLASPLFANLQGLPPLLIQVGDREVILSDAFDFSEKARVAGVQVKLEVWDGMIHVFQQFASELVAARLAIASIGNFLQTRLQLP